tara:strand:+ start:870 stop:1145 length:276 start_codon:yes stop_codon:yes gene_type:complete
MSDEIPVGSPEETPAAKPKSVMDRIMFAVIALMCAMFGLPMVYSSGTVVGAMFAGTMPSLWTIALAPIGLALVYAAIRLTMVALAPDKRAP